MSQRQKFNKAKILLLGAENVGKTAFLVRYITKRFIGEYDGGKEMIYSHRTTLDREEIHLDIYDVSSDEEAVLEKHIKWADGVLLLYSITDRQSFTKLDFYHSLIQHYTRNNHDDIERPDSSFPMVLAANKIDLSHTGRSVTKEEGDKLARRFESHKFEISIADSADGACEAMDYLLHLIKRDYQRNVAGLGPKKLLPNVKRVFKKKIYRSRSDTLQ